MTELSDKERRAAEQTHAQRKADERFAASVNEMYVHEVRRADHMPMWRKLMPLVLIVAVVVSVCAWALRADALGGPHCRTWIPNPAVVHYSPCETGWSPNGVAAYFNDVPANSVPSFWVGAKWGYGVACITSAGITSSVPYVVYAQDFSQSCTGAFGIATAKITIIVTDGSGYSASYRISVAGNGRYAMDYYGPAAEPWHQCYVYRYAGCL